MSHLKTAPLLREKAIGETESEQSDRLYRKIGQALKQTITDGGYAVGDRLPPERDIAEQFQISRTVVREALIMLELEGFIEIKKGSGIYLRAIPNATAIEHETSCNDYGPFELISARQLIESQIASVSASHITETEILRLKSLLAQEKLSLEKGEYDHIADEQFHLTIAESTQNSVLVQLLKDLWQKRHQSPMWQTLHQHIDDHQYRKQWVVDHERIFQALEAHDHLSAHYAMWQHLENVKQLLLCISSSESS